MGMSAERLHRLDAFIAGQINYERLFAPVVYVKLQIKVSDCTLDFGGTPHVSHRVTRGRFYFDDAGTKVRKDRPSAWGSHPAVNFDD